MIGFIQQSLARVGYQLTRTRHGYFKELFRARQFDHLIDVGANRGQFLSLARAAGYAGPATAFEPIAEHRSELEAIGNVQVFVNALGQARGAQDLRIYSSTDFSSFHALNDRYTGEYRNAPAVKEVRQIEVFTLDELGMPGSNIFLKIDAQGADADVLRGASRTLERVSVLLVEVPFLHIYDGGCSAADLFTLTEAAGLYPARIFANSITSYSAWVDADVVFVRKP
jgi:FkbM family methyltransferase